ncbi:hypothetical protein Pcinc_033216 [Petrolisthes cinctipes]|uniref:Uncharacterized protein n=1 Tax=Petrolisthes cinctipes TaxID=88211 RepID=A0AAE1ESU7_PETCI|nr:hypothetical protein Pcinc_033216 [Petrolisthes cinctipes]
MDKSWTFLKDLITQVAASRSPETLTKSRELWKRYRVEVNDGLGSNVGCVSLQWVWPAAPDEAEAGGDIAELAGWVAGSSSAPQARGELGRGGCADLRGVLAEADLTQRCWQALKTQI